MSINRIRVGFIRRRPDLRCEKKLGAQAAAWGGRSAKSRRVTSIGTGLERWPYDHKVVSAEKLRGLT